MSDDIPVNITCSFGIAALAPEDKDVSTVLNRADLALYRAKTEGRNRVVLNEGGNEPPLSRRIVDKEKQDATGFAIGT